jgi:hypothetical protein
MSRRSELRRGCSRCTPVRVRWPSGVPTHRKPSSRFSQALIVANRPSRPAIGYRCGAMSVVGLLAASRSALPCGGSSGLAPGEDASDIERRDNPDWPIAVGLGDDDVGGAVDEHQLSCLAKRRRQLRANDRPQCERAG